MVDKLAALIGQGVLVNEGRPLTDMEYMILEAELSTVGYRLEDGGFREGGYDEKPPSVMESLGQIMTSLMELRGVTGQWVPLFKGHESPDPDKKQVVREFLEAVLDRRPHVNCYDLRELITKLWDGTYDPSWDFAYLWDHSLDDCREDWDLRTLRLVSEVKWMRFTADDRLQGRSNVPL